MKRLGKPLFAIVVAILVFLSYGAFCGISSTYNNIKSTYLKLEINEVE